MAPNTVLFILNLTRGEEKFLFLCDTPRDRSIRGRILGEITHRREGGGGLVGGEGGGKGGGGLSKVTRPMAF